MAYELKRLNARHKRMVSLILEGRWNQKQIASIMGLTPQAVGIIVNSPAFQDEVARRRENIESIEDENIANGLEIAKEMINREAPASVHKLIEIRDESQDHAQARMASSELLKLAFGREGGPAGSSGNLGQVVVMNADKIQFLMQCAKEAGIDVGSNGSPSVVEGTVVGTPSDAGGNSTPAIAG